MDQRTHKYMTYTSGNLWHLPQPPPRAPPLPSSTPSMNLRDPVLMNERKLSK